MANELKVHGIIADINGIPQSNESVEAYHKDYDTLTRLGSTATSSDSGEYEITYSQSELDTLGVEAADLVVKVVDGANPDKVVSPLVLKAEGDVVINLAIGSGDFNKLVTYQFIKARVETQVNGGNVDTYLNVNEAANVAAKTNSTIEEVHQYVQVKKVAGDTSLDEEMLFGLASSGKFETLNDMMAATKSELAASLITARDNNEIDPTITNGSIQTFISNLKSLATTKILSGTEGDNSELLGYFSDISLSDADDAKKTTFLDTLLANEGDLSDFWTELRANPGTLSTAEINDLEAFADLIGLTGERALALYFKNTLSYTIDDLVGKDTTFYTDIFDAEPSVVEITWDSRFEGATETDKKNNYAQYLVEAVENEKPSATFVAELKAGSDLSTNAEQFVDNEPSFDFGAQPVGSYIDENAALDFITDANDRAAARFELESMQRLYRIAPNNGKRATVSALHGAGINSATDIHRMGETAFVNQFGASMGPDEAKGVFHRASQLAGSALHLISNFHSEFNALTPYVIDNKNFPAGANPSEADETGLPNLHDLFGNQSMCACEHCRSVYSPAAYLVDLLHWLDEVDTGLTNPSPQTLKEAIDERRPEIQHILLTCENTNTPLPYVDLAIEVLENALEGLINNNRQTTQKAAALKAHPEHVLPGAYEKLRKKIYPWSAPFDLFEAETHVYLEYLGVDYAKIRDRVVTVGTQSVHDGDLAAKKLKINPLEKAIILADNSAGIGYDALSGLTVSDTDYYDVSAWSELYYDITTEFEMSKLMDKSGLTFNEIRDYTESLWIMGDDYPTDISFATSECDPEQASLDVGSDTLVRLMRFHKLRMKLGWTIAELDTAIETLPTAGNLDNEKLMYIAYVQEYATAHRLDVLEVISWWADLSTQSYHDEPDYFTEQFVNPSVNNTDELYEVTDPTGTGTPASIDWALSDIFDHADFGTDQFRVSNDQLEPLVLAGVRLNETELGLLLSNTDLIDVPNLSFAYRVSSFCDMAGITIEEYLKYVQLFGIEPVKTVSTATTPKNTAAFLELLHAVQKLGFSTEQLDYIITDATIDEELNEDDWEAALGELQTQLIDGYAEMEIIGDNTRENVIQYLNLLEGFTFPTVTTWTKTTIETLVSIMDGTSGMTAANQLTYINDNMADLLAAGQITVLDDKMIDTGSGSYIENDKVEERYEAVFLSGGNNILADKLDSLLWPVVRERIIADAFAAYFEADPDVIYELIVNYMKSHDGTILTTDSFISLFTDHTFIDPLLDLTQTKFETNGRMLHKLVWITNVLHIDVTKNDLEYLFNAVNTSGLPDLTLLHTDQSALISQFNDLWKISAQQKTNYSNGSLLNILYDANDNGLTANFGTLENLMGWTNVSLALTEVGVTANADFYTTDWYYKVKDLCLACAAALVEPDTLANWTGLAPNILSSTAQTYVQAMSNACKSKNGEAQWNSVAPELRDELRRQQVDALADVLIFDTTNYSFVDRYSLYEYFLIDTEMDPCRMTTRIKQANSTVQLFVQRMLMNLEDPYKLTKSHVKEWEWRKNYRVWEANRKVFLYPENWIEPELRDDKTQLFKDMEDELQQQDITMDTAKTAFLNYLEKLDDIADLEVAQLYMDTETNILHVFARTRAFPHRYYYRTWVEDAWWTEWELIETEIETEHLVPTMYNSRLMLFWASVGNEVRPEKIENKETDPSATVHINWSEYKDGKWTKRKRSKNKVWIDRASNWSFDDSDIYLKSRIELGKLVIEVNLDIHIKDKKVFISEPGSSLFLPHLKHYGVFLFQGCNKEPEVYDMTKFPYDSRSPIRLMDHHFEFEKTSEIKDQLTVKALRGSDVEIVINDNQFPPVTVSETRVITIPLLKKLFSGTRLVIAQQLPNHTKHIFGNLPFFFEDPVRTLFVRPIPERITVANNASTFLDGAISDSMDTTAIGSPLQAVGGQIGTGVSRTNFFTENDTNHVITGNVVMSAANDNSNPTSHTITEFTDNTKYQFHSFTHKHVCTIVRQLNLRGMEELFKPVPGRSTEDDNLDRQQVADDYFVADYDPDTTNVALPYPQEDIDFSVGGGYSLYNWELFFHAPMMIATELTKNQKFEEAQKWFHFIFDPTMVEDTTVDTETGVKRFWRTKPFHTFNGESSITAMMNMLNAGNEDMIKQVEIWRRNPFMPHAIARLRYVAYMKNVVMKYLDMLIAWGDQLFTRDSIESVNEATQVYLLALQILGRKPELIERNDATPESYNDLAPSLDSFSNALVAVENTFPIVHLYSLSGIGSPNYELRQHNENYPSTVDMLYFCIPKNDKLWGYWETVADRLFKIRHCMNIEGVVRQLPLFEPPIDPAMLVRAAANGISIAAALNDMNAAMPFYKFQYLQQKAVELTQDVKSLGSSLLSALEKQDGEEMAQLRQGQEVSILEATKDLKMRAIEEANINLQALQETKRITEERAKYYRTRKYQNKMERQQLRGIKTNSVLNTASMLLDVIGAAITPLPKISTYIIGPPPDVEVEVVDGAKIGKILNIGAMSMRVAGSIASLHSQMAGIKGGHNRRKDDWKFQAQQAKMEIEQIAKQIQGAEIRKAIAERDLEIFESQIDNAKDIATFMKDKWTNKELYSWMSKELSKVYFQAYQMAYDMAKKAEKAYHYEIGIDDDNTYINFGLWDSLRKGLLSGEKLHQDLKRLDIAHIDRNKRNRELSKQISLAIIDPEALERLKNTGKTDFNLGELMYDLDHPGHYMRRIKSVSVSIPCVTGPYTGVTGKLTLLQNRIRKNTSVSPSYDYQGINDTRFIHNTSGFQSISTSRGQNDSGLFELNFNDARYLPFEGLGAIGSWRFELPFAEAVGGEKLHQFDYGTISDLILTVNYTAQDGGSTFKTDAETNLVNQFNDWLDEDPTSTENGLYRAISLKHEFPTELHQFLNPTATTANHEVEFSLTDRHFPQFLKGITKETTSITLLLKMKDGIDTLTAMSNTAFELTNSGISFTQGAVTFGAGTTPDTDGVTFEAFTALSGQDVVDTYTLTGITTAGGIGSIAPATGVVTVDNQLDPDAIDDIVLIINYTKA